MAETVLVGRQSSHFTRVVRIVAAELEVPLRLQPILDLMSLDPADYGGNPALKLPVLLRGDAAIYGCLNICRVLAAGSGRGELIVFPEHGLDPLHLGAGELVFNAMGVHTEIVFHEVVSRRPPDAASLKRRAGLLGSLAWLDANLDAVLARLPPRRTSVLEVALFCLLEHIPFRNPMDLSGFSRLADFVREFGARPSAQATPYCFDRPPGELPADAADATRIDSLVAELDAAMSQMARGEDLEADPRFAQLVELLSRGDAERRMDWVTGSSVALGCASLAAMSRAGDTDHVQVARVFHRVGYHAFPFGLQFLARSNDPRALALFLLRVSPWAADYPVLRNSIWQYLGARMAAGVVPVLEPGDAELDWTLEERRTALADFDTPMVLDFLSALEPLDQGRAAAAREADFAHCPAVNARLDGVVRGLQSDHDFNLLLVGEIHTGKSALLRAALRSLSREGWTVVEASPRELLAGLEHVHPIEERIESLVAGLSGDRHVWHALRWYQLLDDPGDGSPMLIQRLWPFLQQGRLRLVGTCSEETRERAIQDMSGFEQVFNLIDVPGLYETDVRQLAEDWVLRQSNRLGTEVISTPLLDEAMRLAKRRSHRAEPGRSLGLLQAALARASPADLPFSRDAIVAALAARTGLPTGRIAQA